MYSHLGSVQLKTGQQMDCGVVLAPDHQWAEQIRPLLSHKGREWGYHIASALEGPLDQLETRFYIGTVGGRAITHVQIVSARGVGILGHVYTVPEYRQRGAYSQLMAFQMEDCRRLGIKIMTLGTGFETHPYWIYQRFGFRSIDATSGRMKWLAEAGAERAWFRAGVTAARRLRWDDWAALNVAAMQSPSPDEELPRSWAFRLKTYGNAESSFVQLFYQWSRGAADHALTLETEHGAVVGWAVLKLDDLTFGEGRLLDLYVHPSFRDDGYKLLEALNWPQAGRVAAYTTGPEGHRALLLRTAGFRQVAALPGWFRHGGESMDLHVFTRE